MTRTTLLAIVLAAATAQAAHAQRCSGGRSYDQIIADCDTAFPGYGLIMSARGWCYIIGAGTCVF